jgi:hypothetical protein
VATVGEAVTAAAVNDYYVSKVEKLREQIPQKPTAQNRCQNGRSLLERGSGGNFVFSYVNAGQTLKIIKSMKSTGALGRWGLMASRP